MYNQWLWDWNKSDEENIQSYNTAHGTNKTGVLYTTSLEPGNPNAARVWDAMTDAKGNVVREFATNVDISFDRTNNGINVAVPSYLYGSSQWDDIIQPALAGLKGKSIAEASDLLADIAENIIPSALADFYQIDFLRSNFMQETGLGRDEASVYASTLQSILSGNMDEVVYDNTSSLGDWFRALLDADSYGADSTMKQLIRLTEGDDPMAAAYGYALLQGARYLAENDEDFAGMLDASVLQNINSAVGGMWVGLTKSIPLAGEAINQLYRLIGGGKTFEESVFDTTAWGLGSGESQLFNVTNTVSNMVGNVAFAYVTGNVFSSALGKVPGLGGVASALEKSTIGRTVLSDYLFNDIPQNITFFAQDLVSGDDLSEAGQNLGWGLLTDLGINLGMAGLGITIGGLDELLEGLTKGGWRNLKNYAALKGLSLQEAFSNTAVGRKFSKVWDSLLDADQNAYRRWARQMALEAGDVDILKNIDNQLTDLAAKGGNLDLDPEFGRLSKQVWEQTDQFIKRGAEFGGFRTIEGLDGYKDVLPRQVAQWINDWDTLNYTRALEAGQDLAGNTPDWLEDAKKNFQEIFGDATPGTSAYASRIAELEARVVDMPDDVKSLAQTLSDWNKRLDIIAGNYGIKDADLLAVLRSDAKFKTSYIHKQAFFPNKAGNLSLGPNEKRVFGARGDQLQDVQYLDPFVSGTLKAKTIDYLITQNKIKQYIGHITAASATTPQVVKDVQNAADIIMNVNAQKVAISSAVEAAEAQVKNIDFSNFAPASEGTYLFRGSLGEGGKYATDDPALAIRYTFDKSLPLPDHYRDFISQYESLMDSGQRNAAFDLANKYKKTHKITTVDLLQSRGVNVDFTTRAAREAFIANMPETPELDELRRVMQNTLDENPLRFYSSVGDLEQNNTLFREAQRQGYGSITMPHEDYLSEVSDPHAFTRGLRQTIDLDNTKWVAEDVASDATKYVRDNMMKLIGGEADAATTVALANNPEFRKALITAQPELANEVNMTLRDIINSNSIEPPVTAREMKDLYKEVSSKIDAPGYYPVTYSLGGREVFTYVSDPNVARILTNPTQVAKSYGLATTTLARVSQMYRFTTTGINPSSWVRNIIRDPWQAMVMGWNPDRLMTPTQFFNQLEGLDTETKQLVLDNMRATLGASTETQMYAELLSNNFDAAKSFRLRNKVLDTIQAPMKATESFPRMQIGMQEFVNNFKRTGNVDAAMSSAIFAGRNATTNFRTAVLNGQNWTAGVPYLRSAIAGTASFKRLFEVDPIGVSLSIITKGITPIAAITLYNLSTSEKRAEYERLPEWYKDSYLFIAGDDMNIALPIPQEIRSFTTMTRQLIESAYDVNDRSILQMGAEAVFGMLPVDVSGFLEDENRLERGIQRLANGLTPQGLQLVYELFTNQDLFTGAPIDRDLQEGQMWSLKTFVNAAGNIFGTGAKQLWNSAATLLNAPEAKVGRSIADTFARDFFGVGFDEANNQFWAGVASLNTDKETLIAAIEKKKAKMYTATDTEKDRLWEEIYELQDEYGTRVKEWVDKYRNMFQQTGGFDQAKRNSIIRLLTMGTVTTTSQQQEAAESEIEMSQRQEAIERYLSLGIPEDRTVQNVLQGNTSLAVSAARGRGYGAPARLSYELTKALDSSKIKDARNRAYDQISAVYDAGGTPDYDKIAQIQANYLAQFDKAIRPVLDQYGYTIFNNNQVVNELRSYLSGMIPSDDWRQSARNAKKFLSTKDFPTATVDVEKWLLQRYKTYMGERTIPSDTTVTRQLESIRSDLNSGKRASAIAKANTLKNLLDNGRAYASSSDVRYLNSLVP